jgi:chemotaxis signal transduction protein
VDVLVEFKAAATAAPLEVTLTSQALPARNKAVRVRAGGRSYRVAMSELDAVVDCPPLSRVPWGPDWLIGVGGLDGRMISVVDLASASGDTSDAAADAGERILVTELGGHLLGFAVTEVTDATDVADAGEVAPQLALRALARCLLKAATPQSSEPTVA